MEKGAKVIRLCQAIIHKGWEQDLLHAVKEEKGVTHKMYLLLHHIIRSHNAQGVPLNATWSLAKFEAEQGALGKTLWELKLFADDFLVRREQVSEYSLQKKIALFYAYRSLDLHKENQENLEEITSYMEKNEDRYMQLIYANFRQEAMVYNKEDKDYRVEVSHALYIYVIGEMLFDACVKLMQSYPKAQLQIPQFPVKDLQDFIGQSPLLYEDATIELYLKLWDFLQQDGFTSEMLSRFEAEIQPLLPTLAAYRKRDVIALIYNKCNSCLTTYRKGFYAEAAWKYLVAAIENGWGYMGNKLEYKLYRNLILLCILANEEKEDTEALKTRLLALKQDYAAMVVFPSAQDKQHLLFEIRWDWKVRENLGAIYKMSRSKFTEEGHKAEMMLYKLKAGYVLQQNGQLNPENFWSWVWERIKKKSFYAQAPFDWEFAIWRTLYYVYKQKAASFAELKVHQSLLENEDKIYHDRKWYLSVLAQLITKKAG